MSTNGEETFKSPIINGVLCYSSTARHSIRYDDIVRICLAFFKDEEIIKGKDILCGIIGERPKRRRNENRLMHEVRDILDILKRCDDDNIKLPKFVVDSYDGLPPTAGFELIAHSLSVLNDEILSLKKEIEYLKDNRIEQSFTVHDVGMIKEDLITIKGELRKINHKSLNDDIQRSHFELEQLQKLRSTPVYIDKDMPENQCGGYDDNERGAIARYHPSAKKSTSILPSAPLEDSNNLFAIGNRTYQDDGGTPSAPAICLYQNEGRLPLDRSYQDKDGSILACSYAQAVGKTCKSNKTRPILRNSLVNSSEKPSETIALSLSKDQENGQKEKVQNEKLSTVDNEGFTLVRNTKKTRQNIVGSKKYSGDQVMKSARRVGDLYLGNLDLNVTAKEIIDYIKGETNISVTECIPLDSRNPNCRSFKISVPFESRVKLLAPEIWPEGVICRKFYNPRNK